MKTKISGNFDKIASAENLLEAWKEFLPGKRGKRDVQEFSIHLMDNLLSLRDELMNHTYRHGGYQAFNISDPKPRNIHKAQVRDRVLHHAVYRILYLFFDHKFVADSFSCRLDKGTHKAIKRFEVFGRKVSRNHTRTAWVLKCDIRKFFANVDHGRILAILKRSIQDQEIVWLLWEIIESFHSTRSGVGVPLGNLTSQLLVNIYMNEFDQFVKHRLKIKYYIRYADDFVFLSEDRKSLIDLIPRISDFLKEELKLSLHPDKLFIKTLASGVDFLGWVHFPDHRVLRTATKRRMFRNIHRNPKEATLASYRGLLKHGNSWKLDQKISKAQTLDLSA